VTKKPKHVISHVFAETTHVVAAPCGFACVVIPPTRRSYIFQVSSKSVQGFLSAGGSKFAHFHYFGYWLLQQPTVFFGMILKDRVILTFYFHRNCL